MTAFDPTIALIEAADGDQRAWNELVERYSGLVWSVARSFRFTEADAGDVFQATWFRLVEKLGQIRNGDGLGSWLATTARNEAIDMIRRRGRESPADVAEHLGQAPSTTDLPEEEMLRAEERRLLWQAVDRMPERCGRLLRAMGAQPAPSYAELAAALDMPVGSIGPTRARCLDTLRGLLTGEPYLAGRTANARMNAQKHGEGRQA
ncbi:sigma-70 family RNA polymerase sigma factor [Dactylosporangium sp. NPDC005555]|uniref:RNA polymerase sigma factor n=1 Tax=Dactylosporangium sp. NPDC005555 TaxID=3154889 RepID=UPI00339DCE1C